MKKLSVSTSKGAVALPIVSYIKDSKFHKEGHIGLQLDHAE